MELAAIKAGLGFLLKACVTGFGLATGFQLAGFLWGRVSIIYTNWYHEDPLCKGNVWLYFMKKGFPRELVPTEFQNQTEHYSPVVKE